MLKHIGLSWVLVLAVTSSWAQTPRSPQPPFPQFDHPSDVAGACERGLAGATSRVRALERRAPDSGWIDAMDDLIAHTEDASGPIYVLSTLHPDKAMRQATEACELRWQDFQSTLYQNTRLYRNATRVRPRDAIEREFMRRLMESFEDAGVTLPPAQRRLAKALQQRIDAASQAFQRNVRDQPVQVAAAEAELGGLPRALWGEAARDAQGRVVLPINDATYPAIMRGAADAGLRERVWRADNARGGEANLRLLAELGRTRLEFARLFGANSYADFTLRRTMARNTTRVQAFLGEVQRAVVERERAELAEMRAGKAKALGKPPADVKLERWDAPYYGEQIRRTRFALDEEAQREHFPPQDSLRLAMRMIEKLLGVTYTRLDGVPLWHPDAQAWQVSDAATKQPLATLYVDLFAREGKSDGAFVWSFRNSATRSGRLPQAVLVTNLDRRGLTLEEFGETLLHEFGHSVHSNLSRTRFAAQGGTNVLRDFVEAPSHMLEDWIYEREVLALMREVCASCKPVPDALLERSRAAKGFGRGVRYARQALFASFDLAMHGQGAPDPMAAWTKLEGQTPLGYVPGSIFPAGFGHVAGGYAAGYYGYLWSEVLAADLRTAFKGHRLDPAVGQRYRDTVLSQGGERPPQELVRAFLGRDSNSQAFFEELKR